MSFFNYDAFNKINDIIDRIEFEKDVTKEEVLATLKDTLDTEVTPINTIEDALVNSICIDCTEKDEIEARKDEEIEKLEEEQREFIDKIKDVFGSYICGKCEKDYHARGLEIEVDSLKEERRKLENEVYELQRKVKELDRYKEQIVDLETTIDELKQKMERILRRHVKAEWRTT